MTEQQWWMDVERDPIHARAAEWLARLESPQVSLEETIAWQEWMEQNPRHAEAFARMEELSVVLNQVPRPDINETEPGRPKQFPAVFKYALAASTAAVAIAVAWILLSQRSGTLQTAIGENRTLRLDDGSQVTLGGDTTVKVRFSQEERRIELSRGEALFTVAKEAARPFKVHAGDTTVTAVGTEFNVRRGHDRVVVAVVEGRVQVDPARVDGIRKPSPQNNRTRQLGAGEQITVDKAGLQVTAALLNPAAATAWQSGQLTFRSEPLRYVLEDVNRYAAKPIVLDQASFGELQFTGTVLSTNVGGWVASLENVFTLKAVEEGDRIVLVGTEHSSLPPP